MTEHRPEHRPTVRDLVKRALTLPTDDNGEPVYAVAGYCGTDRCDMRWHQELLSTLVKLNPVPTRMRCPECGRYLSPRGHAPYQLRRHYPITGEIGGCRFHPDPGPIFRPGPLRLLTAAEFVRMRPRTKVKRGPRSILRVGSRCADD